MGWFGRTDGEIAGCAARLAAERDLTALASELSRKDPRRRAAAAEALASFGAVAVPPVIAATLPRDDTNARLGAWTAFAAIGRPACTPLIAAVASIDTLTADDIPATLRYYQRAAAAVGPGTQDDLASLLDRDYAWHEAARACLEVRDTRRGRLNRQPAASGRILVPIALGSQSIETDQAEDALRATTRQWAITCLLGFAARGDLLTNRVIQSLEATVMDAVNDHTTPGADGFPVLAPVEAMRRHETGDDDVLARLQADLIAARAARDDFTPEERTAREDLLMGTLALGVLRKYSHNGAGLGLTVESVVEAFGRLAANTGAERPASATTLLAALELCRAMHLRAPATELAADSRVAPVLRAAAGQHTVTLDRATVLADLALLQA